MPAPITSLTESAGECHGCGKHTAQNPDVYGCDYLCDGCVEVVECTACDEHLNEDKPPCPTHHEYVQTHMLEGCDVCDAAVRRANTEALLLLID